MLKTLHNTAITSLALVVICIGVMSTAGFFSTFSYMLDTASQLRVGYLIVLASALLCLILLRAKKLSCLAAFFLVVNAIQVYPLYAPRAEATAGGPELKIMTFNIWGAHNKKFDDVANYFEREAPDIICINEHTPLWIAYLDQRLSAYPYRIKNKFSGGNVVYSKFPLEELPLPKTSKLRRYTLAANVDWNGRSFVVMSAHPPAPVPRWRFERRNKELLALAKDTNSDRPVVLIGDLNCTPWSGHFQQLVKDGNLQDSELGFGVQPSWSTKLFLPLVPIDHCLTSRHFVVRDRQIGRSCGSDHLPVAVRLQWKDEQPKL